MPDTLSDWLQWIERCHPRGIEMGLERVGKVYAALQLDFSDIPVVTVAGTNGKGSCIALLDSVLSTAGWRTGVYTSPHFLRYNERVCIAGQQASDEQLCEAFAAVETARGDIPLTYFEFGTLAALLIFQQQQVEILLLEVGLGGRLDAVNLVPPDIAVITSVALDHTDWLGDDLEQIGREKAGILREGIRLICGESEPPASVLETARQLSCDTYLRTKDFSLEPGVQAQWTWRGRGFEGQSVVFDQLPPCELAPDNVATALQVLVCLNEGIDRQAVATGIANARLSGRCQHVEVAGVDVILDVAHNPAAAEHLARHLQGLAPAERTAALFAVMGDKDIPGIVSALQQEVEAWFLGDLKDNERAIPARDLAPLIHEQGIHMISVSKNIRQAYRRALSLLGPGCRLVVFGSFFTVSEVMAIMDRDRLHNKGSA